MKNCVYVRLWSCLYNYWLIKLAWYAAKLIRAQTDHWLITNQSARGDNKPVRCLDEREIKVVPYQIEIFLQNNDEDDKINI